MKWLNYQHLYYFWCIVTYGGVTKASEKLRLSQPTVSAQIKSLEEMLGDKLFKKQGRELVLSDTGTVVFEYAEKIFSLGTELLEVLEGKEITHTKEFKIGIADVIPKTLAFKIIKPVFKEFDNVKVVCLEDKSDTLLAELAVGGIDLVISDQAIPSHIKVKGYSHLLGASDISFLGSAQFKKQYKKGFPQSLQNAPMLIPSEESNLNKELLLWLEEYQEKPKILATFQDTALMKIAAKEKFGIIPIPKVIAPEICKELDLEIIGHTDKIKERLYIISLERRLKNPIILEITKSSEQIFS